MRVKLGSTTKDVPILEVTKENYIVPKGEEGTYHCRIEQTQFNQRTGKRVSSPRIQKFEAKMFPTILRNLKQQGWDVDILHDPTEFNAEQERKRQEMQEMTYQQRREAEAKRKEAEKQALKEEILAEMSDSDMMRNPIFRKALEDLQREIEELKKASGKENKPKEQKTGSSKK